MVSCCVVMGRGVSYLSRHFGSLFNEYKSLRNEDLDFEWLNIRHKITTGKKKIVHVKNMTKDAFEELEWVANELLKLETNMIRLLPKDEIEHCIEVFCSLKEHCASPNLVTLYDTRRAISILDGVFDKLVFFFNLPELEKLNFKCVTLKENLSAVRNQISSIEKFDSTIDDINFYLFLAIDNFEYSLKEQRDLILFEQDLL